MSSHPVRRAGSIKSWVMWGDFLSRKTSLGAILSLEFREIAGRERFVILARELVMGVGKS